MKNNFQLEKYFFNTKKFAKYNPDEIHDLEIRSNAYAECKQHSLFEALKKSVLIIFK